MTIQENKDYREVASTIETLNKDIVADDENIFTTDNQHID